MPRKLIAGESHTKASFGERWSSLTKKNINDWSEDDRVFLKEVLYNTDSYRRLALDPQTKVAIETRTFQKYPTKGIVLISPNSKVHIWLGKKKITEAIFPAQKRKEQTAIGAVHRAFRQLIEEDIRTERHKQRKHAFADKSRCCPLSGTPLHKCKKTHLDHAYPFSAIVDDFLRLEKLEAEWIQIKIKGTYYILVDKDLANRWILYHRQQAVLQLTCAEDNIKKSNKII